MARRLIPVITFALVLFLAVTGILSQAGSRLALTHAQPARPAGQIRPAGQARPAGQIRGVVDGAAADLSATVGVIPGAAGAAGDRTRPGGRQPSGASAVAAKPLRAAAGSRP